MDDVKKPEVKPEDGTQEKPAQKEAPTNTTPVDENGNPIEAKASEAKAPEGTDTGDTGKPEVKQEDLTKKVETRAKQVEDLVKAADVNPSELIAEANRETGELSVAHKAKLIEKHGEAIADLIEGNVGKMLTDLTSISKAKDQAVYDLVQDAFKGITEQTGKETWVELSTWTKANTTSEERAELNKMLSAGGLSAKLAVQEMVSKFQGQDNYTVEAELLDGDHGTVTATSFITRQEYKVELDKLLDAGHDYNTSPQVAALDRRRERSMRVGR